VTQSWVETSQIIPLPLWFSSMSDYFTVLLCLCASITLTHKHRQTTLGFSLRLIRPLFIVWNRLKPFEQFALKLSFGFWTVWYPVKCIIWRKILECFHQKPSFLFDWRKKDMDILDDMGVSKLSAKVYFFKSELLL